MSDTIQELNGELVVVDEWHPMWNEPLMIRKIWPTGVPANWQPQLIGKDVRERDGGLVEVVETGQMIRLIDGGATRPIKNETQPIPQPKGKKRYERGEWRK